MGHAGEAQQGRLLGSGRWEDGRWENGRWRMGGGRIGDGKRWEMNAEATTGGAREDGRWGEE